MGLRNREAEALYRMALSPDSQVPEQPRAPWALWEYLLLALALSAALVLGFSNLAKPSLWHDELVHVFVAKSIAETGRSLLPNGLPYVSGLVFNYVLGAFIRLFGAAEHVVRAPSVLFAGLNVVLVYVLTRRLLGRPAAVLASLAIALSPWSVAWSRQARFYAMHETFYLVFLMSVWSVCEARNKSKAAWALAAVFVCYVLSVLVSLHSILFLAAVGLYAFSQWIRVRTWKSPWFAACILIGVVGITTLLIYKMTLPPIDQITVNAGADGAMYEESRPDRLFYFRWLWLNLSRGYFALALAGFMLMLLKTGRKGLFTALAFWAPLALLTWIGYRRPRFMYFAYPFYVMAFSYGAVELLRFLASAHKSKWRMAAAVPIILLGLRLALSTVTLCNDSLEVAQGDNLTLARLHPQWRKPCLYVRGHATDEAIITTTALPVLYYVGRVDASYPTRFYFLEGRQAPVLELPDLDALRTYTKEHPKGYFLTHYWRFEKETKLLAEDLAWVEKNMTRIEEASSKDVTLYAWGMTVP